MKTDLLRGAAATMILVVLWLPASSDDKAQPKAGTVYPTAILSFEERGSGVKDHGAKVGDILFAKLGANADLHLVDRDDLKKILQEQELNVSGLVKAEEATAVGRLTGAKVLVTGSVFQVDKRIYVVAKIIGTETSRVVGTSVDGKASDEFGPLVEKLAEKVGKLIVEETDKLVPAEVKLGDRVEALNQTLKKAKRPAVFVKIAERHVGQATFDPAAQTEIIVFCRGTGFEVIDPEEGVKGKANVLITGEGISEFGGRRGNLVTVKARLEVKAVDRKTDKVIAIDRQTVVLVDLTEQIAGKSALQNAAAAIAERMLPKLAK